MEAKPFLRAQSIRSDVSPHLPVPICDLSDTGTGVAVSGHCEKGKSDTETGVAVSGHCKNGKSDTERSVLVSMVPFK